MKNWKTTIAGIIAGAYPLISALMEAYSTGYFTNLEGTKFWMGIGMILIGVLAKDFNQTGGSQGILGTDRPNDRP